MPMGVIMHVRCDIISGLTTVRKESKSTGTQLLPRKGAGSTFALAMSSAMSPAATTD